MRRGWNIKLVLLLGAIALANVAQTDPETEDLIYGFVKKAPPDCDCEQELQAIKYVSLDQPSVTLAAGHSVDVKAELVVGGELERSSVWHFTPPFHEIVDLGKMSWTPRYDSDHTVVRLTANSEIISDRLWKSGQDSMTTSSTVSAFEGDSKVPVKAILKIVGEGTRFVKIREDGSADPDSRASVRLWEGGEVETVLLKLMSSKEEAAPGEWTFNLFVYRNGFGTPPGEFVDWIALKFPQGVVQLQFKSAPEFPADYEPPFIFPFEVVATRQTDGLTVKRAGRIHLVRDWTL